MLKENLLYMCPTDPPEPPLDPIKKPKEPQPEEND